MTEAYRRFMPTEFPGLLLWGVPSLIVWLAGPLVVFRAVIARRERSPRGLRLTMTAFGLFTLGVSVGLVVAAAVRD